MKKTLLFVGLAIVGLSANAQIGATLEVKESVKKPVYSHDRVADTVTTFLDRATGLVSYGAPNGGNGVGNGYVTVLTAHKALDGVGQYFDAATGDITEILFVAAEGDVINTADDVTVAWYTTAADSTPNTMMGSATVSVNDFNVGGGFGTSGTLTPTAVGGMPYACIMEWAPTIDDSVGLAASQEGDGMAEDRLLMKVSTQTSTETGGAIAAGWQKNNVYNGFDFDVMLIPVMDVAAGTNEIASNGLHVDPVYPNPTSDMATISYTLDNADDVNIRVFNLAGQEVYTESATKGAGQHRIDLDVTELTSGNYYYSIRTSTANLTMKFVVTK